MEGVVPIRHLELVYLVLNVLRKRIRTFCDKSLLFAVVIRKVLIKIRINSKDARLPNLTTVILFILSKLLSELF